MYEYVHSDLPPTAQMFPMEDRGTVRASRSVWPFLEVASLEKWRRRLHEGNVSSVLVVGVWGMQPLLFHLPCSAGCGIHFGSDWSLQGNFVQARDCQDGCIRFGSDSERWLLSVLSECPGSWSSMVVIKKDVESERKRQRVSIISCLIIWEVLGSIVEDTQDDQSQLC